MVAVGIGVASGAPQRSPKAFALSCSTWTAEAFRGTSISWLKEIQFVSSLIVLKSFAVVGKVSTTRLSPYFPPHVFADAITASTAAFSVGNRVGHAVTTLAKSGSCKPCVPICVPAFVSCSCFSSSS